MTATPLAFLAVALCLISGLASGEVDCPGATVEIVANFPHGRDIAIYGYPSLFGAHLNDTATHQLVLRQAEPQEACGPIREAAGPGAAVLVARGNCTFVQKARAAQEAHFSAMILYDTQPGCVFMSGNSTPGELTLVVASVSQEAGQLLQQVATEQGNVTLRAPNLPPVDFLSAAALWLMAVGTVVGGALWSMAELNRHLAAAADGAHADEQANPSKEGGESDVSVISARGAVSFIFVASAMLLLLYFFLSTWFIMVLIVLFAFGAWQTLSLVLLLALLKWGPHSWAGAHLTLPYFGPSSVLSFLSGGVAAAVSIGWFVWRHSPWAYVLQDTLGISLMLVIFQQLRLPNVKVASILYPLAWVYDVWWVFLQPLVTGGDSVMIAVATGSSEQLPMLLEVPRRALGSSHAYSMLGYGDVILPGLLCVFAARYDTAKRLPWHLGYFVPVVAGYGMGLVLTWLALLFSVFGDDGQPALLYLVPCTLGTVAVLAWWRGEFWEMWSCGPLEGEQQQQRRGAQQGQQEPEEGRLEAGLEGELGGERRALLPPGTQSPSA